MRLVVTAGPGRGAQLRLGDLESFEVGRASVADLTVDDPGVAGIHLKFTREGPASFLCYDVSGVGYQLNGGPGPAQASVKVGDRLGLGQHGLQLVAETKEEASPATTPPPTYSAPAPNGHPALQALQGNDVGKSFELKPATMILGRGVATDLTIWDIRASRAHCRVDPVQGGYQLTDLNSSNGTFLNGRRMSAPHRLQPGDLIRIGSTVLRYQGPS